MYIYIYTLFIGLLTYLFIKMESLGGSKVILLPMALPQRFPSPKKDATAFPNLVLSFPPATPLIFNFEACYPIRVQWA